MNKIRHCCYMIGEDLGTSGLLNIKDFPEKEDVIHQMIFMSKLLTELENVNVEKFTKRKNYIKDILN